jgi:hypothetical protein
MGGFVPLLALAQARHSRLPALLSGETALLLDPSFP